MNLLACVASYAREVAQTQPLACAKLLTFERVADYRAVLADLDAAHPSRLFFALGAEIFALREHPSAVDAAFRDREWARLYPALVRLVPLPPDTPWQRRKDTHERLFHRLSRVIDRRKSAVIEKSYEALLRCVARGAIYPSPQRETRRRGRQTAMKIYKIVLASTGETQIGLNGATLDNLSKAQAEKLARELRQVWARPLAGDSLEVVAEDDDIDQPHNDFGYRFRVEFLSGEPVTEWISSEADVRSVVARRGLRGVRIVREDRDGARESIARIVV